jgi:murein DD-endopeptidase MepM/ murein hydrolase activator NlpD
VLGGVLRAKARRFNTIIFVPHTRARFRRLRISSAALWGAAGTGVALVLASLVFASIFFLTARKDRLYRQTLTENERLKSSAEKMTLRLSELSKKLDDFEERTRKLAIVAGMPALADPGRGGLGGAVPPGENSYFDVVGRGRSLDNRLAALEKQINHQNLLLASTPSIEPVRGLLTCGFGERSDPFSEEPAFHTGVDISSQRGHGVIAAADGIVVKAGWVNGYGRCVEISHGLGLRTLYGHLDDIRVLEGERVTRGTAIGVVGTTGRSTGPHLHYEVRLDNRPVNPLQYILDLR